MATTYSELPNKLVSAANGIDYAYRETGESAVPLVLLQHFRGNLDNWHPALIVDVRGSLCGCLRSSARSAMSLEKTTRGVAASVDGHQDLPAGDHGRGTAVITESERIPGRCAANALHNAYSVRLSRCTHGAVCTDCSLCLHRYAVRYRRKHSPLCRL
jgi:hypothetical protein